MIVTVDPWPLSLSWTLSSLKKKKLESKCCDYKGMKLNTTQARL